VAKLSANFFENMVKVKAEKASKRLIDRSFSSMKRHIKDIAKRWKHQAQKFLSKPSDGTPNTTKYPRKESGQLRDSVYYTIRSYKGKRSFSFRVSYGFHEVYSDKSKKYPHFAYGDYLNRWKGKPFAGYRERINKRMKEQIESFIEKKRRLKSFKG